MKIAILLPYKENFSPEYPGAVSLFVNETSKISRYKKICLIIVRKICKIEDFRNREVFEIDDKKFFLIKIKENYFFFRVYLQTYGGTLRKRNFKR